ncbi:MAG: peptidase T [Desulfobacterales bacterium]|nr:peptidase T [Desulfobacterales bacterium]
MVEMRIPPERRKWIRRQALERFQRYVAIDTRSDPQSGRHPSTDGQGELARRLQAELAAMHGLEVTLDDYGYLYIARSGRKAVGKTAITFCAHLDTSPSVSGRGVKPVIHRNYDGEALHFADDPSLLLTPEDSPELLQHIGEDIVTASGRTLLGADDKAGLAAIMTALEFLHVETDWPHPELRIVFTPDEEIGEGADHVRPERMGQVGYTIDGGALGELEAECFHALRAEITFSGLNVHPGYAKNRMINAAAIAARFAAALPAHETPENTAGREGFHHLTAIGGNESKARLELILRDFDAAGNARRVAVLEQLCATYRALYPGVIIDLAVEEQYRNMKEVLERHPDVLAVARQAFDAAGVAVVDKAIRGGTDGARFCFMGIPTPNIFAGGLLFHSRKEWIPVRALQKSTEVILQLCRLWAQSPPRAAIIADADEARS